MERWLPVTAVLTVLTGVVAFTLIPVTGMTNHPAFEITTMWMLLLVVVAFTWLIFDILRQRSWSGWVDLRMVLSGLDARRMLTIYLGWIILGLNLAFFGVLKPELGHLVPFTADPSLAWIDHAIFGTDPWKLLTWLNRGPIAWIYHRGWFVWLAFVLFYVLRQQPSEEKNALLISYVALWSLFGPLIHLVSPAAGPVFFHPLGFGTRFDGLRQVPETQAITRYLWTGYQRHQFNVGGGISAMPSLHLATMFWAIIAVRRTRALALAIAFTAYIYLAAVALGWHYFVDGLVGAAGAILCYAVASTLKSRALRPAPADETSHLPASTAAGTATRSQR